MIVGDHGAGDHGAFVTTGPLAMERFEELAAALGTILHEFDDSAA